MSSIYPTHCVLQIENMNIKCLAHNRPSISILHRQHCPPSCYLYPDVADTEGLQSHRTPAQSGWSVSGGSLYNVSAVTINDES